MRFCGVDDQFKHKKHTNNICEWDIDDHYTHTHTQKHSTPHQFLITPFDVRLLEWLVVSGPAVGNEVAEDGRIVGDLRTGPSNH